MSAKNRGTKVQAADAYMTPPNLAQACVDAAIATFPANRRTRLRILEPSAGTGAFVSPLRAHGTVMANELNPRFVARLKKAGASYVRSGRTETIRSQPFDLILGNPPFSMAAEHISCLSKMLKPNGRLFMLLRINFLGAQCRAEFWERHPPHTVHVIRPRAYFLDSKGARLVGKNGKPANDATEYALFEWRYWIANRPFQFVEWTR